jgi:hypothetical protein
MAGPAQRAVGANVEPPPASAVRRRRNGARAFAALVAAGLCAAAGALIGYWAGAGPVRARLADSRAAERRLTQSNAVLRGRLVGVEQQLAAVPQLQEQVAALEMQKQQLAQRNERILANTRPLLRSGPPLLAPTLAAPRPVFVQVRPLMPALPAGVKPGARKSAGGPPPFAKSADTGVHPARIAAGPHPELASTGAAHAPSDNRAAEAGGAMALLSPVGASVATDRPAFTWRPMARDTSYVVVIYDASGDEVVRSPALTDATWTPTKALSRGQTYQWEVVAYRDGRRVGRAPQPPAPSAKFTIAASPRSAGAGGL